MKKHRKYFQIDEDGLIFCLREANKRRFAEHRIPTQRKLAMEISSINTLELIQNDHGHFQLQNLREVIQTTMEISKVNISLQLIENGDGNFQHQTLVDTNDDGNCQKQKLELIQNDQGHFQRQNFG